VDEIEEVEEIEGNSGRPISGHEARDIIEHYNLIIQALEPP
jgi:hypothetical protein